MTNSEVSEDGLSIRPADGRKRILKVSAAELNGIREILANPKPPTPEL